MFIKLLRFFYKRPLLTVLCSVLSAFIVALFLPELAKFILCTALILLTMLCLFAKSLRKTVLLTILPFALAILWHFVFVRVFVLPNNLFADAEVKLKGKIVSNYHESSGALSFTLRPESLEYKNETHKLFGDVVVYCQKNSQQYPLGSVIVCDATVFANDESIFENYRATEGNYLSLYASKIALYSAAKGFDIETILPKIQNRIVTHFSSVFDRESSSLISGILLGNTENISLDVRLAFKNSGVSHTLAVSGMHLTFLTMVLWLVLALFCKNLKLRAVLLIIAIWMFTAVTGFSPSCCRAAVMLTVFHLGVIVQKEPDTYTSLAVAVAICCVGNPIAILNPSLMLSATSTFGILCFSSHVIKIFPAVNFKSRLLGKGYAFIRDTISMSVAATVGTLPIMAFLFQSVSLLAPIANLLIVPIIEILFFIGFGAICFGWMAPVASLLSWIARCLVRYCLAITAFLSDLPFSTAYTGRFSFWLWCIIVFIIMLALFLLLRKKRLRWLLPCYVLIFALLIGVDFAVDYASRDLISVRFASVGQGNATVISNSHDAVLIDCGGSGTGYWELSNIFIENEIKTISEIYITHLDMDHIRYCEQFLSTYEIECLYLPRRAEYSDYVKHLLAVASRRKTDVRFIGEDASFCLWDNVKLRAFTQHIDSLSSDENKNSLVYQLVYGDTEILFSGDVEKDGEYRLLSHYRTALQSDILLAAHHGSNNGSVEEFLNYVDADVIVVSVGKDNPYNLPNPSAIKRLKKYSSTFLRTDTDRSIEFVLNGQKYKRRDQK